MSNPLEVHSVIVQIKRPTRGDEGQVAEGRYTLAGNLLTLTDRAGEPVRDDMGRTYAYKLSAADQPGIIAGRLTKQFRLALRGKGRALDGFNAPIRYPKSSIV